MNRLLRTLLVGCCVFGGTSAASGAFITVGDHELTPNADNQFIPIRVTGGEAVDSLDFYVRIDDGLSPSPLPAPTVTAVDLVGTSSTPTIFYSNHTPPNDLDPANEYPYYEGWTVTTTSGTVPADGLVALVNLDTRGVYGGSWDLILKDPAHVATDFPGVPLSVTDGRVWIAGGAVPEPSAVLVWSLLSLAGFGLGRRRRAGQ